MKKKNLKNFNLNKKSISNLTTAIYGGNCSSIDKGKIKIPSRTTCNTDCSDCSNNCDPNA